MKIIHELTQVSLPTEAYDEWPCGAPATDPEGEVTWVCTRVHEHDGPHVATYDYEGEVFVGLAWVEEAFGA